MMAAAAKKRGRPRKRPEGGRLHHSPSPPPPKAEPRRTLRPLRRRPLHDFADFDDYLDEEEEEEQERREKRRKLEFLLRLPPPIPTSSEKVKDERLRRAEPVTRGSSSRSSSASSSSHVDDDDDEGDEDEEVVKEEAIKPPRKPQFDKCYDAPCSGGSGDREKRRKNVLQASNGFTSGVLTSSQAGGIPLPERKLLEAILDKIQKKDTYGVFAEPVDPEELPDYYDVIEHPMDFGTVRKKLASNAYHLFEQFQDDVFLICSNAMQYNAPNTIYYRQARSMQDMGRKEFQKIRTESKCIETDSKCEEKISFNSKVLPNCPPGVMQEPFVSEISSAAILASRGDACTGSTVAEVSGAQPAATSNALADGSSSLGESRSEKVVDLNVRNSPSKLGKKLFEVDEDRRATYNICNQQPLAEPTPVYDILEGEERQMVAVGLDAEYSYARSLARFAVNLGPIAWRVASQRIQSALPSGVMFGPGWVGEYEPPFTSIFSSEKHARLQQHQLDAHNSKMPLKMDKVTATGKKTSGIDDSKQYNIQSQLGTRTYSRDSDPVERGSSSCVVTGARQQQSNVTSSVQVNTDVTMSQQQNKQVDRLQEHQPSSSFSRFANQTFKRPEVSTGISSSVSPTIASLDRKPLHHESQKQTGTTVPCNTTNGLRVNDGELSNGNVLMSSTSNSLDDSKRVVANHQHGTVGDCRTLGSHEHGPGDPSRSKGFPIKNLISPNISSNSLKPYPSTVPPSSTECSDNTVTAAAARAWMSIGASSQSKLSVDTMGFCYSPSGSACTSFNGPWRTQISSSRISDASKTAPQAFRQPIQVVGLEPQVHNRGLMIFPQLAVSDMSRFQGQIPWQGLVPQTQNKQNQNICPPDLNISFQPPGSPIRNSPRMHKDAQQPDLALQL
ncbi:hypothetical protein Cni_G00544 [Canna indica]|uniref:Bromo domain-containing protein n=1 Tax=Canna indica TaxID=4628 RepID=A0AAQ3PXC5_9LILI|nr:hypothetical protein Cni_G00544 [Canna indica]